MSDENPIITLARVIDPEAWAHAEEYAAMVNVATPQMQPFFHRQVERLTEKSLQAALRVYQHLQPSPADPPIPDVLAQINETPKPNRKTRRSTK